MSCVCFLFMGPDTKYIKAERMEERKERRKKGGREGRKKEGRKKEGKKSSESTVEQTG